MQSQLPWVQVWYMWGVWWPYQAARYNSSSSSSNRNCSSSGGGGDKSRSSSHSCGFYAA